MTDETKARQVLADLKDQLAALELKKAELEDTRDQHSYDAFTGDAAAKTALSRVTKTLIEHDQHVAACMAAIREGQARLEIAQGAAREEIERKRAEAALQHGKAMLDGLKAAQKAFTDAFAALADAHAEVVELGKLGCPPAQALFEVNCRRAIIATSMHSRFALGHFSPPERHSLTELGSVWANACRSWAEQRLTEPKAEAA
jgi:hypothetical protein